VDGYVVDKAPASDDLRRWTTRDFAAEDAEWVSGDGLTMLGAVPGSTPTGADEERSVYGRGSRRTRKPPSI
jgi:hypothetical protein